MGYPAYSELQDSGMAWLGKIPAHWESKRLRFALQTNPSANEIDLEDDALVSFIPMDAVGESCGLRLDTDKALSEIGSGYTYFANGDVVVAKITPCFENGKGAIAEGLTNGIAFGTTELHVLRANGTLDKRFLFHLTTSQIFHALGESEMYGAGGQKRVPDTFIKNFRAAVPPLPEQNTIARFLDHKTAQIDALIAKKEALLHKLAEKRTALISQAVTQGLDPSVPMKDSGVAWLGQIPAHWEIVRLRFLVEKIEQGWSPQCDNQPAEDDEWGVLKVGCVNGEYFDESENKALPTNLEIKTQYEIQAGDILISRANTKELLGSAAIANTPRKKLLLCDKLYRLIAGRQIDSNYLVRVLRSTISRMQYERDATGVSGSMQNIGQGTIKDLVIPVPPLEEQKQVEQHLSTMLASISASEGKTQSAISALKEYRSALITAAVTGKIDVRGVTLPPAIATEACP